MDASAVTEWAETRAALGRLATSWRNLQEARRRSRNLNKLIAARKLVARALRLHPRACDFLVEVITDEVVLTLYERGFLDMDKAAQYYKGAQSHD
jgi:hypothetical protein